MACGYGEVVGRSEDKKLGHGVPRARYGGSYAGGQRDLRAVSKSDVVNVIEPDLLQLRGSFQIPLQNFQIQVIIQANAK